VSVDRVRAALRSDERTVIVEAAAGCGKTFEAALLATEIAPTLPPGREVLLLAHTNAAVQEFARRTDELRRSIRVSTIDAFCLQLLEPYAPALDLPNPLRRNVGPGGGRIPFDVLATKALDLLTRCTSLARVVALHYPMIILDEHQDARPDQHAVVRRIADAGDSRVRIFGDPMQAIYEREEGEGIISWETMVNEGGAYYELDTPQRWRNTPELGAWIMSAREQLRQGRPLPLEGRPGSVRVQMARGMPDPRFGRGQAKFLSRPLHQFLNRADGRAAVLTHTNRMVSDIQICAGGRLIVNEGAGYEAAYTTVEKAKEVAGSPQQLANVLLCLLKDMSTGLDARRATAIKKVLDNRGLLPTRNREVCQLLPALRRLYENPSVAGFCSAVATILECPPDWLTVRLPETLRVLGRIRPSDDEALQALDAVIAMRKARPPRTRITVSTVHKAKGLEFDDVLVCPFSATQFPDTNSGRRLAYVALSRASRSIELLVPEYGPSPLAYNSSTES
jgi:UvrD-like helicase C-terminal domain/AAA domain